jgi:hypothetical protein
MEEKMPNFWAGSVTKKMSKVLTKILLGRLKECQIDAFIYMFKVV